MLRCKEGDLAIGLLESRDDNYGKIVEVIEFYGKGMVNGDKYSNIWLVSIAGDLFNPKTGKRWAVPDAYLLPIRPDELKEEEERGRELVE